MGCGIGIVKSELGGRCSETQLGNATGFLCARDICVRMKQLTAIKATEDLIGPLESGSKGWFENDECVVKRLDQLKARARKMKPAQQKKKGGKSASGSRSGRTNGGRARKVGTGAGGWSTVAKSKGGGNRFSAFD